MRLWIFCLLGTLVKESKALSDVRSIQSSAVCNVIGYYLVEGKFGKETHWLCLKMEKIGSSPLTKAHSTLLLEPDNDVESNSISGFSLADVTMAYGFPVEESTGSAEGYIGDDHQFYGVLHLGNRTLNADPYNKDDPLKSFGAFENDDITAPRMRRENPQIDIFGHLPLFPYEIENNKKSPGAARARICDLLLLADKEFYEKDANSSLNHVVRRMMHAVAQADIIFRNADFDEDGVPDNIGFSVKYILVLTSEETNTRVFGNVDKEKIIDGRTYLMKFARLRRLSEVCLGVAFSGYPFQNRTLGLSFTSLGGGMGGAAGGLCDRRAYGKSYNTLAVSHATLIDRERVPERISALTLAHELGHSFGAHHDDNFSNRECRGHLMGSQSSLSGSTKTFEFSLCSRRLIAETLNGMSYCLKDEDQPYCGNGIVEEGEDCDCGLPSKCIHKDPCCTPRAGGAVIFEEGTLHKEGCSVAPTAMCHPSQGLCCAANCQYADLTSSGINCKTIDQECACTDSTNCTCGLGGRCMPDGSCHAAECALLGFKECQCLNTGTVQRGALNEIGMCRICCTMPPQLNETESRCVGADIAAQEYYANAPNLPKGWPGDDYIGPNVTIVVHNNVSCSKTRIRAWPTGSPCVTQNTVGTCSSRGVCLRSHPIPRSNVYPNIQGRRKNTDLCGSIISVLSKTRNMSAWLLF